MAALLGFAKVERQFSLPSHFSNMFHLSSACHDASSKQLTALSVLSQLIGYVHVFHAPSEKRKNMVKFQGELVNSKISLFEVLFCDER